MPNFQDNQAGTRAMIMVEEQQLVLVVGKHVQYVALADELMLNGFTNLPLQIEHPEDQLGPSQEAPNRIFYIYAPVFHWHTSLSSMNFVRRAIEQLVDEAFGYGQQTEHHEQLLLNGQLAVESCIKELWSPRVQVVNQL